jgi:hypothetical protein
MWRIFEGLAHRTLWAEALLARQLLPDLGRVGIIFFDALGVRPGVLLTNGRFFNNLLTNGLV